MTNDSHHNGISLEIAGLGEAAMAWVDDRNGNLDIYGQRMLADHENNTITTLWSTVEEGGTAICFQVIGSSTNIILSYIPFQLRTDVSLE